MTEIISRKDAKRLGLKRYFNGIECKRSHLAPRYTKSKKCILCDSENKKAKYNNIKDSEEFKANRASLYREKCISDPNFLPKRNKQSLALYYKDKDAARKRKEKWKKKNLEAIKAKSREYRARESAAIKASSRSYYLKNRESILAKARKKKQANRKAIVADVSLHKALKEKMNAAQRERYKNDKIYREAIKKKNRKHYNPIKQKERANSYRAKKVSAEGSYSEDDITRLLVKQAGACANCLQKIGRKNMHRDHIIPLSRGGSNYISNIQLLCRHCNISKGAKDPIDFARLHGRLL